MEGIKRLTFTRFLAAMIVVIFHFGRDVSPWSSNAIAFVIHNGQNAVIYFYCLSGFIMAMAYPAIAGKPINRLTYWTARFARIYPVFVVAMIAGALLNETIPWWQLFFDMIGLQAWDQHQLSRINPPAWSISVEAAFYLIFPFVLPLFARERIRETVKIVAAVYCLSFAMFQIAGHYAQKGSLSALDFAIYNPILHIHEFLVGVLFGSLLIQGSIGEKIKNPFIPTLLILSIFGSIFFKIPFFGNLSIFSPIWYCWLMVAIAQYQGKYLGWMGARFAVLLGEASYAIYILQYPVRIAWVNIVQPEFNLPDPGIATYLASLVLLALAVHLAIERPARKIIKKLFGASRSRRYADPSTSLDKVGQLD